ncbi:MAG: site-2 protease family protein [Moorellales bacterium]
MLFLGSFWREIAAALPALLLAISFHEYAHARVAVAWGDPTPARQGRLTLNPLAHLDPLGTLLLIVARFGWARPVEINPFYFQRHRRLAMITVGLAGPGANLLLAYAAAVALTHWVSLGYLAGFLGWFMVYNLVLAAFNLIPLPPLDGSKVVGELLPASARMAYWRLETYGPWVLLILVATGMVGRIMSPLVQALMNVMVRAAGASFF